MNHLQYILHTILLCCKHTLQELERLAGEADTQVPQVLSKVSPNPAPHKKAKVGGTPPTKEDTPGTPANASADPYACGGPTPKKLFSDELDMLTQRSPDHDEEDFQRDLANVTCPSQKSFVFFSMMCLAPFSWGYNIYI